MKPRYSRTRTLLASAVTALLVSNFADAQDIYQQAQQWPISLGTSGGNVNDRSRSYCCSGTLGALVQDAGGQLYILSNNHVLARLNQAAVGEGVNHPGMIDQNCRTAGTVATLSSFVPIQFWTKKARPINYVDAAIAAIQPGAVATEGSILTIGTVIPTPLADTPGLWVCKSGRTTGYTVGTITDVDVNTVVGYSTTCGGRTSVSASFSDQILIAGEGWSAFSSAGDSGSLIVEVGSRQPVGLLFAGTSTHTVANPIGRVLSALNVYFPGGSPVVQGGAAVAQSQSAGSALTSVKAVKARNGEKLMGVAGAHGHGIGVSQSGELVIRVYVAPEEVEKAKGQLPKDLEGVPVELQAMEPFVAY